MKLNTDINIEEYLNEEDVKEIAIQAVKEYTKDKCEKFFGGLKENEYRTLFETVCLGYMLDNYKEEVERSVKCCLDHIATQGLFKPRWYDNTNQGGMLFDLVKRKLSEHTGEFKDAILQRIRNTDENILVEILTEVVSESVSKIFTDSGVKP